MGVLANDFYRVPEFRLRHALEEIEETYGHSCTLKKKTLIKFGRLDGLNQTRATVQTQGGFETFLTDNLITHFSSTEAGDTGPVYFEGHTIDGTGKKTFVTQTKNANGQNKVALDTPIARSSRGENATITSTALAGTVYLYEDTAITAGVPDDLSKVHLMIEPTPQQSKKAATSFSDLDYFLLTGFTASVLKKTSGAANFILQVCTLNSVFKDKFEITASDASAGRLQFDPVYIIPPNADVRILADGGINDLDVTAEFGGYLALRSAA